MAQYLQDSCGLQALGHGRQNRASPAKVHELWALFALLTDTWMETPSKENRFWKPVFGKPFLDNVIGLENRLWKSVFGNRFWQTIFGKQFLENRFWKTVFGKRFLENRFGKTVFRNCFPFQKHFSKINSQSTAPNFVLAFSRARLNSMFLRFLVAQTLKLSSSQGGSKICSSFQGDSSASRWVPNSSSVNVCEGSGGTTTCTRLELAPPAIPAVVLRKAKWPHLLWHRCLHPHHLLKLWLLCPRAPQPPPPPLVFFARIRFDGAAQDLCSSAWGVLVAIFFLLSVFFAADFAAAFFALYFRSLAFLKASTLSSRPAQ